MMLEQPSRPNGLTTLYPSMSVHEASCQGIFNLFLYCLILNVRFDVKKSSIMLIKAEDVEMGTFVNNYFAEFISYKRARNSFDAH